MLRIGENTFIELKKRDSAFPKVALKRKMYLYAKKDISEYLEAKKRCRLEGFAKSKPNDRLIRYEEAFQRLGVANERQISNYLRSWEKKKECFPFIPISPEVILVDERDLAEWQRRRDSILSFHQMKDRLGVSKSTFRAILKEAQAPPFYQVGQRYFCRKREFEAWIHSRAREKSEKANYDLKLVQPGKDSLRREYERLIQRKELEGIVGITQPTFLQMKVKGNNPKIYQIAGREYFKKGEVFLWLAKMYQGYLAEEQFEDDTYGGLEEAIQAEEAWQAENQDADFPDAHEEEQRQDLIRRGMNVMQGDAR